MFSSLPLLLLLLFMGAICNYKPFQTRGENKLASANFAVSLAVLFLFAFLQSACGAVNEIKVLSR